MSISPFAVGQLLPVLQVTLNTDGSTQYENGSPLDLTGLDYSDFSLNIYNTDTATDQTGTGIFIVYDAPNGIVQYAWDTADTANPGNYQLFISASFTGRPLIFDPIPLEIVPK